MITVPKLILEDAKIILEGAEMKAKEIGVDMDIAVVDDGGNLLAFYRMDKAKITSIDVAINKAFTAAGARKATHEYAEIAGAGGPAFGI
ncbi:MAG TPA: heme-binding protein, partial [Thermodesulfobacteriota bacterium]|nr:heme-binding protein [Thermodesulfobacteriota bacterium]